MKILTNYDLKNNQLLNVVIHKLTEAPANPVSGQIYFNTISKRIFVYTGTEWRGMDAEGATMTAENIVDAINNSNFIINLNNLPNAVKDAVASAHTNHEIADINGLEEALNEKVDNSRVLTDVPGNAKFTDTITTINGKTGVIEKSDIVALGIPERDTTYTVFSADKDGLVPKATAPNTTDFLRRDGSWAAPPKYTLPVATDDTLGGIKSSSSINISEDGIATVVDDSHNHIISNIDGLEGALAGKVDNARVLSDVPANAKFTDTITTINGKTGEISKEDIVALGIPEEDTTYTVFSATKDGLVPKTDVSNTTDFLRRDGSWAQPPTYTLPVATTTTLGGVKSGGDIEVDASGIVTVKDNSHDHTIANISGLQGALDSKETPSGAQSKADAALNSAKSYTDSLITSIVDSAPDALNTFREIAEAIGEDPNFATTIFNALNKKANKHSQAIGNGLDTTFVVTHNLDTRDVVITIRETSAPYAQVITDVEMTTTNTVTVKFAEAPATDQYTITIIG